MSDDDQEHARAMGEAAMALLGASLPDRFTAVLIVASDDGRGQMCTSGADDKLVVSMLVGAVRQLTEPAELVTKGSA